jgi:NTE family protein
MINPMNTKQKSLGLVLSGGGARGFAHIGVLKVLLENNIKISAISGCSMGGLLAALYACGISIYDIENIAMRFSSVTEMIRLVDRSPKRRGLIVGHRVRSFINRYIADTITFKELKLPLFLTSVDLITSKVVVLNKGNLLDSIMATIALPGFFAPVAIDDKLLVDGGVLDNLPSKPLNGLHLDKTIAVDVHVDTYNSRPFYLSDDKRKGSVSLPDFFWDFYQAEMIMVSEITRRNNEETPVDYLIRPDIPSEITMFLGFQKVKEIISAGEEKARQVLPEIIDSLY